MNNIPTTGELFATNQVSANTERCYKPQLHNFAEWMADIRDVRDMKAVSTADLLAYRQSIKHLDVTSQNLFEQIEYTNISLYANSQLRKRAVHATAVEKYRSWRISKHKAANKIGGIVILAMAILQAGQNRDTGALIIGAW